MEFWHVSLAENVARMADARTKCNLCATSKYWRSIFQNPLLWGDLEFRTAEEQENMDAQDLFRLLHKAKGRVVRLQLARTRSAEQSQNRQRFDKGYKRDEPLPFTVGLRACALAGLLGHLQHLCLDERASCLGGMTNDFARALGSMCPNLRQLQIFFRRYSLPSELFDDNGMIALAEGCCNLQVLKLHHCSHISNRSFYAIAGGCKRLRCLEFAGYSEQVSDDGLLVLISACPDLEVFRLSGKLLKATDACIQRMVVCGQPVREVKLTMSMTRQSVKCLRLWAGSLKQADVHCCSGLRPSDIMELILACSHLSICTIPSALVFSPKEQELLPIQALERRKDRTVIQLYRPALS